MTALNIRKIEMADSPLKTKLANKVNYIAKDGNLTLFFNRIFIFPGGLDLDTLTNAQMLKLFDEHVTPDLEIIDQKYKIVGSLQGPSFLKLATIDALPQKTAIFCFPTIVDPFPEIIANRNDTTNYGTGRVFVSAYDNKLTKIYQNAGLLFRGAYEGGFAEGNEVVVSLDSL